MSKPTYSWDTSVILAWLTEDKSAPLPDIACVADEIDNNKANLLVSVVVYTEVLEAKHSPQKMAQFRSFLKRSNVVAADNTFAVAQKAGEIRNKCLAACRKIKTPDATIIATAILHKADVLHSLDSDILALDGSPIVDGLAIKRPQSVTGKVMF